jgi:hypothetical protein
MIKPSSGDCDTALVPSRGRSGDSSTHLEMDTNLHPAQASCLKSAYGSVTHKLQQHRSTHEDISNQEQEMAQMVKGSDRTPEKNSP